MSHYIIVLRDDSGWAIGPFESSDAAAAWARAHWDEALGDPRWQTIALPDDMIAENLDAEDTPGSTQLVELPLYAPENAGGRI